MMWRSTVVGTELKYNILKSKKLHIVITLFILLVLLLSYGIFRDTSKIITQNKLNTILGQNKVEKIVLDGNYFYLKIDNKNYKIYKDLVDNTSTFRKYPIEVKDENSYVYDILSLVILFGAFVFLINFMNKSRQQQLKQIKSVSVDKINNYEPIQALTSNIKFSDVAGIKDVKEELEEIIDFLKEPQKYRDMDIRLPKGVLLVGPPGVGKTFISKAVAGEADVPFFYQSGSSFVQIYVGMGAKRVSELFKKAKQMAPSIVFIDEIDAVGKSRSEFRNDEREATLNQLLTEMDGFEDSSGVIVIAATNKIDVLDEALLRAGRFDRRIHISLPDLEDRVKILKLYLSNKPNRVDIDKIAKMTVGFNSAAIDTLTNEAAMFAMRGGRSVVESSDFEAVREKVLLGKRKILSFTEEEREIQAVYQGAKAVIATWLDIEFEKIGIVNTEFISQEHEILSRSKLLSRIKVYLAGSIATQVHYKEQFTNAKSDIFLAKDLARKVIYEYAMSENFTVTAKHEENLIRESVLELGELIETLKKALSKVSAYLLTYENITQKECKKIIDEIF